MWIWYFGDFCYSPIGAIREKSYKAGFPCKNGVLGRRLRLNHLAVGQRTRYSRVPTAGSDAVISDEDGERIINGELVLVNRLSPYS